MKKLSFLFLFLFILSLNFIGKFTVSFAVERSLYNFITNLIFGACFAILVLTLLRGKFFKKDILLTAFVMSQGIVFYFLLTQPRLFEKIILTGFYFSGIYLSYYGKKRYEIYFPLLVLILAIVFEISGTLLFEKNFMYLNILRDFLVGTAGYTTGLLIFRN